MRKKILCLCFVLMLIVLVSCGKKANKSTDEAKKNNTIESSVTTESSVKEDSPEATKESTPTTVAEITEEPNTEPTTDQTQTPAPTEKVEDTPTTEPTETPTETPTPTVEPTNTPTVAPTETPIPTTPVATATPVPTKSPAKATATPKPNNTPTVAPKDTGNSDKDKKAIEWIKGDIEYVKNSKWLDDGGWINAFIEGYDFINTREDAIKYWYEINEVPKMQQYLMVNSSPKKEIEFGKFVGMDDSKSIGWDVNNKFFILWNLRSGFSPRSNKASQYSSSAKGNTAYGVIFEGVYNCWGSCDYISKLMTILGIPHKIMQGNNGVAAAHRWIEFYYEGEKMWIDPNMSTICFGDYKGVSNVTVIKNVS